MKQKSHYGMILMVIALFGVFFGMEKVEAKTEILTCNYNVSTSGIGGVSAKVSLHVYEDGDAVAKITDFNGSFDKGISIENWSTIQLSIMQKSECPETAFINYDLTITEEKSDVTGKVYFGFDKTMTSELEQKQFSNLYCKYESKGSCKLGKESSWGEGEHVNPDWGIPSDETNDKAATLLCKYKYSNENGWKANATVTVYEDGSSSAVVKNYVGLWKTSGGLIFGSKEKVLEMSIPYNTGVANWGDVKDRVIQKKECPEYALIHAVKQTIGSAAIVWLGFEKDSLENIRNSKNFIEGEGHIASYSTYVDPDNPNDPDNGNIDRHYNVCNIFSGTFGDIIRNIISWMKLLIPIVIIVLGIMDAISVVVSGEEKKFKDVFSRFLKRMIAGLLIIFVPSILSFLINMSGILNNYGIDDIWCGLWG